MNDRDRVNISPDDVGPQADGLVQSSAAPHHRVKHYFAIKTAGSIVAAAFSVRREVLQDGTECSAAPTCPPLVQVGIRAEQVLVEHLLPGEAVDEFFRERVVYRYRISH